MQTTKWADLAHKASPEQRAAIEQKAAQDLRLESFAALRRMREMTQVELAGKMGIDQASVSGMESRRDLLLSTLTKYIHGLGGEVEIHAIFPDGNLVIDPMLMLEDTLSK